MEESESESIHLEEEEEISDSQPYKLPPMHHYRSTVFYLFLILIEHIWNVISTVCLIIIQSFKFYYFPSPKAAKEFAVVAPFLLFIFNVIKLICGQYGNRSENYILTIITAVLIVCSIIFDIYFIILQIYVWYWELPIVITSMVLDFLLFVFTIFLIIYFLCTKSI